MNNISCKAASPDNAFEVREIIGLFRAVYGESFPLQSVYDEGYWRQHLGMRFMSVLVYQGTKLVGHLSAQPEGEDGKMIQVLYPLCDPDSSAHRNQILGAAWNVLRASAQRQLWRGIYFFAFAHVPEMVQFGEQILGTKSIAVCPAYFPATNLCVSATADSKEITPSNERADLIISQRIFNPVNEKQRSIYVNEQHAELTSRLYKGLGLPREIRTEAKPEKLASYPLPADRVGIETRYFAQSGIMHAYIEPSLIRSDAELAESLQSPLAESVFVLVKGYDPKALQTADWLENAGYEFSGVLPFIHDRESLLFTRSRAETSLRLYDTETVLLSGIGG